MALLGSIFKETHTACERSAVLTKMYSLFDQILGWFSADACYVGSSKGLKK